jgi:hypothetical protein
MGQTYGRATDVNEWLHYSPLTSGALARLDCLSYEMRNRRIEGSEVWADLRRAVQDKRYSIAWKSVFLLLRNERSPRIWIVQQMVLSKEATTFARFL